MSKPKVFIGWAGGKSNQLAIALCDWLVNIIQSVDPFVSAKMDAGDEWREKLAGELKQATYGIFCLTKDNLLAPWIMFEAGAVWNKLERGRVCPYLLDIETSELKAPLTLFQAKKADELGTKDLVTAINKTLDDSIRLSSEQLNTSFRKNWGDLKKKIEIIKKESRQESGQATDEEITSEVLTAKHDDEFSPINLSEPVFDENNATRSSEVINLAAEEVLLIMLQHGLPRDFATTFSIIHKIMISRRFTEIAVNWSLLSLTNSGHIEHTEIGGAGAYIITNKGVKWLIANGKRIDLREPPRK
jgi:hypothetical protein